MTDPGLLIRFGAAAAAAMLTMLLWPAPAQANVSCNVTSTSMSFGTARDATGSINYNCINYGPTAVSFILCATPGEPSWPGTRAQPVMTSGNNQLKYTIYTTAGRTQAWTLSTPVTRSVSVPGANSASGTLFLYGRIPSGQTPPPPPGSYAGFQHSTQLGFLPSGSSTCQANASPNLAGVQFSLEVTATLVNVCTVTTGAGAAINFGKVSASATNLSSSSHISVNCPSGTAYYTGLRPSNGNNLGAGAMSGTGSNAAKVAYQLRKSSSNGPIWGNTASLGSVGNGAGGTGNGSAQSISVHATVTGVNQPPDVYSDTVTVTVHY